VVGSLPESGAEVGNQRGREALLSLETVFGRIQSAWTPAQGTETFEIIRRRQFQELDADGVKARDQAVKAFLSYYKNNSGDFQSEVRDRAYEAQLMAAYPVHPELFRILQTDWGALEKFQKTRGLLKMMAQIVYRLWRDGHAAPLILPGDVPMTDDKVRTNVLLPIANGYDAVIAKEVAGARAEKVGRILAQSAHCFRELGWLLARDCAGHTEPRNLHSPVSRAMWRGAHEQRRRRTRHRLVFTDGR
jgi:predicted AAA+ superfamily ATPase